MVTCMRLVLCGGLTELSSQCCHALESLSRTPSGWKYPTPGALTSPTALTNPHRGGPHRRGPAKPLSLSHPRRTVDFVDRPNRQQIEAASWQLASDLLRRHPGEARLIRGHPGGGQYDLLWLLGVESPVDIRLNREGAIQVWGCVSGSSDVDRRPTSWADYLAQDRLEFVRRLEQAVGWDSPARSRLATETTLTYRVIAGLVEVMVAAGHRVQVQQGFIDTSGEGGGHNPILDAFDLPDESLALRDDDLYGQVGYRFWVVRVDGLPMAAFEQTTAAMFTRQRNRPVNLMSLYRSSGNSLNAVLRDVMTEMRLG